MPYSDRYLAFMGLAPKRIPHWEHWSCPDAETYLTGIDYYEHPRLCRLRLRELYPQLELAIPETRRAQAAPRRWTWRAELDARRARAATACAGATARPGIWDWGEHFQTAEDVFAFSPLAQGDFTDIPVVESQRLLATRRRSTSDYRANYPAEWGDRAPEGDTAAVGFYNTMFMWPLLDLRLGAVPGDLPGPALRAHHGRVRRDQPARVPRLRPPAGQLRRLPRRHRHLARPGLLAGLDAQATSSRATRSSGASSRRRARR